MATKSGVVVVSTYGSSYGNYVVIAHSDGSRSLYAHQSQRAVSVGQTVSQGQVIGYVGTTGSSTGNHLHFEIWLNSSSKQPGEPRGILLLSNRTQSNKRESGPFPWERSALLPGDYSTATTVRTPSATVKRMFCPPKAMP